MIDSEKPQSQIPQASGLGCLVRLAWLLAGHGVLLISLMTVFTNSHAGFGIADVFVWGAVVACSAIRYIDVSQLNGLTATGKPATPADWRRYVLILTGLTLLLWGLAHRATLFGT